MLSQLVRTRNVGQGGTTWPAPLLRGAGVCSTIGHSNSPVWRKNTPLPLRSLTRPLSRGELVPT